MKKLLLLTLVFCLSLTVSSQSISKSTVKSWFVTGAKPTQQNFSDLIDNCYNDLSTIIPWADTLLNGKIISKYYFNSQMLTKVGWADTLTNGRLLKFVQNQGGSGTDTTGILRNINGKISPTLVKAAGKIYNSSSNPTHYDDFFKYDGDIYASHFVSSFDIGVNNGGNVSSFQANRLVSTIGSTIRLDLNPAVSNGSSAIAYTLGTSNNLTATGAKLLSIPNLNSEKFSVDKDGNVLTSGSTYQGSTNSDSIVATRKYARDNTGSGGTTLNGTGFVKASGTTISYDNSTYLPTTGNGSGLTGITASQVGAATNAAIHDSITFLTPNNIAYSTTIPLNKARTIMAGKTLASNDVLTIAANPIEGAITTLQLIGNGTNTLDSSTFNYQSGSYDNANGTINYIVMYYENGKSHISFRIEVLIH